MRTGGRAAGLLGVWAVVCPAALTLSGAPAETRVLLLCVAQKQQAPRQQPPKPPPNGMPKAIPGPQFQRFQQMSPEQREKALSKLPPDRRARIEQQLQKYESLTPAQKDFVNRRLAILQSLSPARQAAVRQELQRLRSLPPAERRAALSSVEERARFSEDEMKLIRGSFGQPGF